MDYSGHRHIIIYIICNVGGDVGLFMPIEIETFLRSDDDDTHTKIRGGCIVSLLNQHQWWS